MITLLLAAAVSSFPAVKVLSVYDGDTFSVNLPGLPAVFGESIGVRLEGIDTAELKDERICARNAAIEARETLKLLLQTSEAIDLMDCQKDKFFRVRCRAITVNGGVDVSAFMIQSGLAVPYSGGTRPRWRCRR